MAWAQPPHSKSRHAGAAEQTRGVCAFVGGSCWGGGFLGQLVGCGAPRLATAGYLMVKDHIRSSGLTTATAGLLALFGVALLLSATVTSAGLQSSEVSSSEVLLAVNPAQSTVHWSVDSSLHLVHGTFALKSGDFRS